MAKSDGRRPVRPQVVLEVVARQQISAHLVRLTFGGPGFSDYQDKEATDRYVKILFAKPELGLQPPYNLDELRAILPAQDLPVRRTYTVRNVDTEARTLDIDFVVHGDEGLAGPWARDAQVGDKICFSGPGGRYAPSVEYDFQFLVGDETAIPAIACALEAMDEDMVGRVIIEVNDAKDEVQFQAPKGIEITWLHRNAPFSPQTTILEQAVRQVPWPEGKVQIFCHGEREVMKKLRMYFHGEREVQRQEMSLSAYWAYGRVEDEFQAEKRSAIGQIFDEEPAPAK